MDLFGKQDLQEDQRDGETAEGSKQVKRCSGEGKGGPWRERAGTKGRSKSSMKTHYCRDFLIYERDLNEVSTRKSQKLGCSYLVGGMQVWQALKDSKNL